MSFSVGEFPNNDKRLAAILAVQLLTEEKAPRDNWQTLLTDTWAEQYKTLHSAILKSLS